MATRAGITKSNKVEPKKDTQLINLSFRVHSYQYPYGAESEMIGPNAFLKWGVVQPFGITKAMTKEFAEQMAWRPKVSGVELAEARSRRQPVILVNLPEEGHAIREVTKMGRKYKTCDGAGSVDNSTAQEEGPDTIKLYHSVSQAHDFMVMLSDAQRIKNYITKIDKRPLVQQFGHDLASYRAVNLKRAYRGEEPLRGSKALSAASDF